MQKRLLILPLFLLIFTACKKEADDILPEVEFLSPADGIQVNVYDTLHVSLHLTDNVGLEHVDVKLIDQNLVPMLPTYSLNLDDKEADVEFNYAIDNIHLTSGVYYLSVEVTDSRNIRRVYRTINITETPRRLLGFFAATQSSANVLNIYKSDTSWLPSLWNWYSSDFTDMEVSPYWQQVYVNGSYSGPLRAVSIDGNTTGWTVNPIVGSSPYWGPMTVSGSRLLVSYRGLGQFKSLDQTGANTFTGNANSGFYPRELFQVGTRIFSEQKDISSSAVRMVVQSTSGGAIQETPMAVDALAMFEKDADNIYMVGNSAGQGKLLIYDVPGNGFWEPISLPAGTATSAAQVDANTLLIGMSNGTVYKFTYNPVGLLTWSSGLNPTHLRYSDADSTVFSAEGMNVKVYNFNPFALDRTIAMPDTVRDMELWFNR